MQEELDNIKALLKSPDEANRILVLAIIEGMDIDIQASLPAYYKTYKFLEKYGQVTQGLEDTVPILQQLLALREIDLYDKGLCGELIDFTLPSLEQLDLSCNKIEGEVPDFTNLYNLKILRLNSNKLRGKLPDFSNLPNLKELSIECNQLSGHLPNFSNLGRLENLNLIDNQLTGSIPDFGYLQSLRILCLSDNQLIGELPNFNNLPELERLFLMNNRLGDTIPNFEKLPYLRFIDLRNNHLEGSVPNLQHLFYLEALDLENNRLSGAIPDFRKFAELKILNLKNNRFGEDALDNLNREYVVENQEEMYSVLGEQFFQQEQKREFTRPSRSSSSNHRAEQFLFYGLYTFVLGMILLLLTSVIDIFLASSYYVYALAIALGGGLLILVGFWGKR